MFAVIETGGKQVRVTKGQEIYVEKLDVEVDKKFEFTNVISIEKDKLVVGEPYIKGAKVVATVLKQGRGSKIIVFKYKRRKNYRRKQGHRQPYTKLVIEEIIG